MPENFLSRDSFLVAKKRPQPWLMLRPTGVKNREKMTAVGAL